MFSSSNLNKLKIKMSNIQAITKQIQTIESIRRDPAYFIYEYFAELVRQVDLRREVLKVQIDAYSSELIETIESMRDRYSAAQVTDILPELDSARQSLNQDANQQNNLEELQLRLNYLLDSYRNSLVGFKIHKLKIEDISSELLFGMVESEMVWEGLNTSKILDMIGVRDLTALCGLCGAQDWALVYRGSEDGFGCEDFHSKCDGVARTLTIVKALGSGCVFGGYTEKAWVQNCGWVGDDRAFIFSLVNCEKRPLKIMCSDTEHAIYCSASSGITFGIDDLTLASDSNQNEKSYSNLGECYEHLDYPEFSERAQCFLAGSRNFRTVEVEIYRRV